MKTANLEFPISMNNREKIRNIYEFTCKVDLAKYVFKMFIDFSQCLGTWEGKCTISNICWSTVFT